MIYCGIDIGLKGALCILHENGYVQLVPFNQDEYRSALSALDPNRTKVMVERVHAFSGQGVTSMFHFGENYGWIQGLLFALGFSFETVDPRTWKKVFGCTSDKQTSIDAAHRAFPTILFYRTKRCKKEHDGMAEAALIADYCRRKDWNILKPLTSPL